MNEVDTMATLAMLPDEARTGVAVFLTLQPSLTRRDRQANVAIKTQATGLF